MRTDLALAPNCTMATVLNARSTALLSISMRLSLALFGLVNYLEIDLSESRQWILR